MCVSALENLRKNNEHTKAYRNCLESLIPLRNDTRIKAFERSAKYDEVSRTRNADTLKSAGSVSGRFCFVIMNTTHVIVVYFSDSYENGVLVNMGLEYLCKRTSQRIDLTALRDRAFIIFGTVTAYRGISGRATLLSDLSMRQVPMPQIALGATIPVCIWNMPFRVLTCYLGALRSSRRRQDQQRSS